MQDAQAWQWHMQWRMHDARLAVHHLDSDLRGAVPDGFVHLQQGMSKHITKLVSTFMVIVLNMHRRQTGRMQN